MTVCPTVGRLLAAIVAVVLVTSCERATAPNPTAPTPTPIDVASLLRRSGETTGALNTFHFKLEHNEAGGTPLSGSLTVTEAEGDVARPDRISTEFAGTLGNFAVRSSLISVGEESYLTNPLTGAWERVAREVSPLGFFDPQQGIGSMMSEVRSPALISHSAEEYRIDGTLDVAALRPLLGTSAQGTTVQVQLTIDVDTLFLKRAVIEGRATATEPDGVVRTITLSNFNESVSIQPPQ